MLYIILMDRMRRKQVYAPSHGIKLVDQEKSNQFLNRPRVVEQAHWASAEVGEGHSRVDAEDVVERRMDVLRRERLAGNAFAAWAGVADGLAHTQAAAGEEGEAGLRPVVAARWTPRFRADARRAPHFAPEQYRHVPIEAALGAGGQQRVDRGVKRRQ